MHNHSSSPTTSAPAPTRTRTEIEIRKWRPVERNTLQGFFEALLPSGMIVRDLGLHENDDGARWVAFPSRTYQPPGGGKKQYIPYIDFEEPQIRKRFQEQILEALDRHLTSASV